MNKKKILNDPVYGFITIPSELIFDLIEEPVFQRLRRIKQLGLTHYVYPGALHTRFHHAIGAMHLMYEAVQVLRSKEIEITAEEEEAVLIAILLHDLGHGPYSHALEGVILNIHHETLTGYFLRELNKKYSGVLNLAIEIFEGTYSKHFLHELVSSQLDMDRMDYLKRDSFYTGVAEGVIGHDRIIKMLNVVEDEIVVEEKGIYSIEKFLMARRLMYWQVYLHKTVLAAEQMLKHMMMRIRKRYDKNFQKLIPEPLAFFLEDDLSDSDIKKDSEIILGQFAQVDDVDILSLIKKLQNSDDPVFKIFAQGLLHRKLFKCELTNFPFSCDQKQIIRHKIGIQLNLTSEDVLDVIIDGSETNSAYEKSGNEIKILQKNGYVVPLSEVVDTEISANVKRKHFLCYPKLKV